METELIKTGIIGLDVVMGGGIRRNTAILMTGAPGIGKTMSCLQFLAHGASLGENGVFITTEETEQDLALYTKNTGIDFERYLNKRIFVVEKPVEQLKGGIVSLQGLLQLIKRNNVKRVVLDSLTFFEYLYTESDVDDIEFRRRVLIFLHQLKQAGTTVMATSERPTTDLDRFKYDMMDYLFDGFIIFTRIRKGSVFERCISVIKLKGQKHSDDIYPITIGKGGVRVLYDQIPYSLAEKGMRKRGPDFTT